MWSQAPFLRSLAYFLPLVLTLACNSGSSSSSTAGATAGVVAAGFTPASGSIGTLVLIQGQGFSPSPFENTIRFGGANGVLATVEVATKTTLLTRVPIGAKSGPIFVSSPAGSGLTADAFFLVPNISAFNPSSAAVGSIVELLGSGFAEIPGDNLVTLNGLPVPVLDGDATKVVVSIPSGATSGTFVVSSGANSASKGPFIVLPSITGASLAFGLPGTAVTISGFNFRSVLTDNQVSFNGTAAVVTGADYFSVSTIAPAGFTTGPITVTTPDGVAIGPNFILPQTPSILNFNPVSGVPGTSVTITGTNFLPGVMSVKFNGTISASVTNQTTTSLDAVVPAGAATGPIEVAHPFASALSASNFTILFPPTVTAIDPIVGAPGTVVHVTGTNFDITPSGNTVTFGNAAAVASISNVTPTGLDAIVPANGVTGPVKVTTAAGSAQSAALFRIVFQRFFLTANQAEHTISSLLEDPATGDLIGRSYAYTGAGTMPRSLATTPNGAFAYASLEGTSEIGVYSLSKDGLFSPVQTVSAGTAVAGIAMHPSGNFLFVANPSASTLTTYAIAANGTLSLVGSYASGLTPIGVTAHPNGGFVYAPCQFNGPNGNNITVMSMAANGALSLVERKGTGGNTPSDFQVHPNGLFGYSIANSAGGSVANAYTIAVDGKLTLVNTQATGPGGSNPISFTIEPTGKRAFVVNQATSDTLSYSIDQVTGALTIPAGVGLQLTGSSAGQGPSSITTDLAGRVFIANKTTNNVAVFHFSPTTGVMTLQRNLPWRSGPTSIVRVDATASVTTTPRFAYVANSFNGAGGNSVSPMQVGANGAVTAGGATPSGSMPVALAADPSGQLLYAANGAGAPGTAFLSFYKIDSANQGALIANGSVNVGNLSLGDGTAKCVTIDPSGRFLYAGNLGTIPSAGDGAVSAFTIDRSQGGFGNLLPMLNSPYIVTNGPSAFQTNSLQTPSMETSNSGQFLYVLSYPPQKRIVTFSIAPADGALTEIGWKNISGTVAPSATLFTLHPNGRFLYLIDAAATNRIVVFGILPDGTVDTSVGSLQTVSIGGLLQGLAMHPQGSFLYVTNNGADNVITFSVAPPGSPTAGQITRLDADPVAAGQQDTATGDAPVGVRVDASGGYLYVANSGSAENSVSAYTIGANGLPVLISTTPLPTKSPTALAVVAQYQ